MRKLLLLSVVFVLTAAAVAQTKEVQTGSQTVIESNGPVVAGFGNQIPNTGDPVEMNIAKEVRHELLMLPYYSLFDDLEYSVQGRTVTLTGSLTAVHSQTKVDAEKAVSKIEGVEKVINNIRVLPPSPFDEQLRHEIYARMVRTGGLSQYFWEAAPSIHIIVLNQNVTLKGYVLTEGDKNLAGMVVKQIGKVFNVKNELQVIK